jgi:hypothetical protein
MNIFDPLISGSLSVSGSGNISGNLTVLGTINATISGTTSNAISASHAASYLLTSSFEQFTGSYTTGSFTGSFGGDGTNLINIPASGVTGLNLTRIADGSVTASVSNTDGLRVNSKTEITGSLIVTDGITGSIDYTNITNKPTLVSGSLQIDITGTTGYSTFSSSISNSIDSLSSSVATTTNNLSTSIATTDLNQSNRLTSIENKTGSYATTGSNLFIGTQTHSGSILPSVDNAYDLGSPTYQWKDVYISSGSLYIDGTKVISSTAQELTITTDTGQSIKILEGTTDSIILQTADGDIELKSSADGDILLDPTNGKIMLKGPIEIFNGNKIQSSVGGTPVVFANDIVVTGSIDITGTIEGINLTDFSSSLNTRLGTLEVSTGSLNSFTSSAIGRLNSIESTTSSLNSYTTSANSKFTSIESVTSSFASYSGTTDGRLNAIETSTGSLNTYSSSTNSRLSSIESTTASLTSTNTTQDGRLTSLENVTGSYATTGSNVFQGNQIVTGSLFISQNLIVGGSSSINFVSQSTLNIGTNLITVNAQNPGTRFGGLAVIDSGSSPTISGSMLFDSIKDEWIFIHQNQGTVTSSVVLMGPQTYNDIGAELYPTTNRIVKSINSEHLGDSNISDNGTTVTILSNAVVNGTFSATGTTLVSGSSQINHNSTTNYDGNQHVDHTTVSISAGSGLSGGGTIASTRTLTLDTGSVHFLDGVKKELNTEGVVSGSSQISFNGITDKPTLVSGSSQITYGSLTGIPSGIVSGSSQVSYTGLSNTPSGIVSGSVQVDLTATTNYSSGIKTRLNAEGVLSGSSQVVAALPNGTVSGSAQVSYTGLSNIPSGIVSGSAQLTSTFVQKGGDTMTGQLIIGSTGTANSPTLRINNSSASSFNHTIEAISTNMTAGQTSIIVLGQAGSTKNAGYLGYNWSSSASNSNYVSLGHWGSDNLLRVYGDGTVFMGTVTTGVWNGSSISTTYTDAKVTSVSAGTGISVNVTTGAVTVTNSGVTSIAGTTNQITASASTGGVTLSLPQNIHTGASPTFAGGTMNGTLTFSATTGNKIDFYYSGDDRYGVQVQSSELRIHSGAQGVSTGGITLGKSTGSVFTEYLRIRNDGHVIPGSNGNQNLGSSTLRWNTLFTSDLSMSNGIGDYTIVEGEEDLFIYNNKTNKVFKFLLQEVDPSIVPPKKV